MPALRPIPRGVPPAAALAATAVSLLLCTAPSIAQSPTTVTPTSPTQLPPASSPLPTTSQLPAPTVNPQVVVGRWTYRRQDDETRNVDTVTIEFKPDGSYLAHNRSSLLPTPEKASRGRYSVSNVQGNAFDLRVERELADPESDPQDAFEVQRITVVNADTLQAADGSLVHRVKE